MDRVKIKAIIYAFLAAVFYAVNVPVSKVLLRSVGPTMIAGSVLVVVDTLIRAHAHEHIHTFTHTHGGTTHTHTVTHSHEHDHFITDDRHGHHHSAAILGHLTGAAH